jgi:anti-sigma regulatory factor (Ser/Thr protein kinase)
VTHQVDLEPGWHETIKEMLWDLGHQWGARPEVMRRLDHAANELLDALTEHGMVSADEHGRASVELTARFDEYRCQIRVTYAGRPLWVPDRRPDPEQLLNNPAAVEALAGYLVKRLADRVTVESMDGKSTISMYFDD